MDIVLIVAAAWIVLDVALVGLLSALSARGAIVRRAETALLRGDTAPVPAPAGRAAAFRRTASPHRIAISRAVAPSRRPPAGLSLPRIGETSVPVVDR